MPEENLDFSKIVPCFKKVGCEAVAKHMWRHAFFDLGSLSCISAKLLYCVMAHGSLWIPSGKKPAFWTVDLPVLAKNFEKGRWKERVTILSALAIYDFEHPPFTFDVFDSKMGKLVQART